MRILFGISSLREQTLAAAAGAFRHLTGTCLDLRWMTLRELRHLRRRQTPSSSLELGSLTDFPVDHGSIYGGDEDGAAEHEREEAEEELLLYFFYYC